MKRIFYLTDEKEFIQSFEHPAELIVWVYRWMGKTAYSVALSQLIEQYYFLN
jgi:hypothetical protein